MTISTQELYQQALVGATVEDSQNVTKEMFFAPFEESYVVEMNQRLADMGSDLQVEDVIVVDKKLMWEILD